GHGESMSDRDQVPDVDQRADGGDLALLRQAPEERFRRVAVLGGLGAEAAEGPPPGNDRRQLGDRGLFEAPFRGGLLTDEPVGEGGGGRAVDAPLGDQDPGSDGGEVGEDLAVVAEHGIRQPSWRRLAGSLVYVAEPGPGSVGGR